VFEPDPASRVPPAERTPPSLGGPHTLQILTTEHWSLLAARSLVYTEAMSRTSMFIAALSGAVVALALVAQATDFGSGFVAFALVLLPVVYFLGLVTIVRLSQVNQENRLWVQGMNRIRNAYLQIAPELEPYFVTSKYDDEAGVLLSSLAARDPLPRLQPLVSVLGLVAVVDSVVAGAAAGIAGLELGVVVAVALGAVFFVISMMFFVFWARRRIGRVSTGMDPIFPSPAPGSGD
jgi:prepilin signal peptidase PulO-like enzyme (type II secretory pathway)